jgi:SAM-dependent methyltransferase
MAYLAGKTDVTQVVGVDGVQKALDEFVQEHSDLNIHPVSTVDTCTNVDVTTNNAKYHVLKGTNIMLLRGDFFALDSSVTDGLFDAVFDRASLVAIDPSLRLEYVDTIQRLVRPGGKILLVVIERNSGDLEFDQAGPPYSISDTEVRRLYQGQSWVESITLLDDNGEQARKAGKGMQSLYFLIQTK